MMIRARAPLRLGLAGGGTDLSPYCDTYGGAILNATIDLYAYSVLEPLKDRSKVYFSATDLGIDIELPADADMPLEDPLALHRGVYRRIVRDFCGGKPFGCRLTTFCEAPPGSGLGSSSTTVVSMVKAFVEYLGLPLGEYDIGHLAYEIERIDLGLAGGRQDQYAATFGGFNFIEFYENDRVIVNPLRIKNWILSELESSIVLHHCGVSRSSAAIIEEQKKSIAANTGDSMAAMHELKEDAFRMKEAVLLGNIPQFATLMNKSWEAKRRTAAAISNPTIERIFEKARALGAKAGKVSGAGGGGFITFIVDPKYRIKLLRGLAEVEGQPMTCHFTKRGTEGWRIDA
jgi:D-glycero-alpha-D-manno-heptose-7-phosphate kinase